MSLFRRFDLLDPSSFFHSEAYIYGPRPFLFSPFDDLVLVEEHRKLGLGFGCGGSVLDDLSLQWRVPFPAISPPEIYDNAEFLLRIERFSAFPAPIRRLDERAETEACLRRLADRVSALEVGFAAEKRDRKYRWEAEVRGEKEARKWKWTADVKADGERKVKWEVDLSGKGKEERTYSFEVSSAVAAGKEGKKGKKAKEKETRTRIVEITDPEPDRGAVVLRKAFVRNHCKGKAKELSPLDAALIIQMNFRAHLVRRSQALRGLRALAVAKAKLKEIRALFSNFSYRRRVAIDAEERQKFSEKIIVLLLTVDAIEGPDYMVRAARKSMVEELEAMLEVIDPLPAEKLGSLKRRKFDLPEFSVFQREMSAGVAEVVGLINQDDATGSA